MKDKHPKEETNEKSNIIYAKLFILLVICLFGISLVGKLAQMFQSRSFQGNSFNVLFLMPGTSYVLGLNSEMRSFGVLKLTESSGLSKESTLKNGLVLGIPIHAIISKEKKEYEDGKYLLSFSEVVKMLTRSDHTKFISLNSFDVMKMYSISKGIPNTGVYQYAMKPNNINSSDDENLYMLFRDEDVINEKTSIEVVNTTDISGLGSRFSRMLKNAGFNVISVTSSDLVEKSIVVYRVSKENNAYKLLSKILPFNEEFKDGSSIADITIILGEDIKNQI